MSYDNVYNRKMAEILGDIADSLREIKKAIVPKTAEEVFFNDEPEPPKGVEEKDLVEVVRCEKCGHCIYADPERSLYCMMHAIFVSETDFCSYGIKEGLIFYE